MLTLLLFSEPVDDCIISFLAVSIEELVVL